jgi:hypothetical protein
VLSSPWAFEALIFGTFFLASAGASAAYLTVSEIFPMETRALAIAFFYAVGTAAGGITGPLLFGNLIGTANRNMVAIAFLIGAGVMALGGIVEILLGVRAEQRELEDIALPLTAEEAKEGEGEPSGAGPAKAGQHEPPSEEHAEALGEAQRRIRERSERSAARARAGLRRYQPGPGSVFYSPGMLGTDVRMPRTSEEDLDRFIEAIVRAVREHGEVERDELARLVGARRWGPGTFRWALRHALLEGRVRRAPHGRVAPSEGHEAA